MAKLELNNLLKQYTKKVIPVKNISLSVEDGEFLTLLGPSGCGKSTLLRLIAGLEPPTEGEIFIGGNKVNAISPGDRNVAMVFQSYALYPHLSVAENIGTALKLRNIDSEEIKSRVEQIANKLDIGHLLDRKPSSLSGGQRQRVALARALVRNPEVFLLDEPLSNLDALLREQVRGELKQLFEKQNKPVVYVTHDQTEALTLSSKVAVLYDGEVQQLAPPSEIYAHPANEFVAGFVGSPQMNLITLKCENDHAKLGDFSLPLPHTPSTKNCQQIRLGIRPEDVHVPNDNDENILKGKVFLVEELGKYNLVSMHIDNTEPQVTIRGMIPADYSWSGDYLEFTIPPALTHWFDVETGERISE